MGKLIPSILAAALPLTVGIGVGLAEDRVDFNRDIRPILSENCYHCHGPDGKERKADLRFDLAESALTSGVIVPGNLAKSELHRRIHETDRNEVMPPPKSKLKLTKPEKALLDRWIGEGAEFDAHWSFVTPERPPPPDTRSGFGRMGPESDRSIRR